MSSSKTTEATSETQAVELEMKRLQCDKLRAEIRDASLAWWQRPGYIASSAPIVLAIIGIFSAWVTGFFNREREILKTEIKALEADKSKLEQDTKSARKELDSVLERTKTLQKLADEVYMKVSYHSSGAAYAISHIKPEGQEAWVSSKDVDAATETLKQLPPADRARIENIMRQYKTALDMIDHVHRSMKSTSQLLGSLPASERVKRLQLTVHPDYDFIDPATQKTYSIRTIDEFLKSAE